MIPTRKQLEENRQRWGRIYGYFTSFCDLNGSCEECDKVVRLGCTVERRIEELQTKYILRICRSEREGEP